MNEMWAVACLSTSQVNICPKATPGHVQMPQHPSGAAFNLKVNLLSRKEDLA